MLMTPQSWGSSPTTTNPPTGTR
uniref:Uncharacterized protein n=1 Tax=Anguilla anguilla TaxID=7936 RepID=A0A0E9XBT6_ANGAN